MSEAIQKKSFILASASPRRLELLKQISLAPEAVIPADIDETPVKNELPVSYAKRIASEKCEEVLKYSSGKIILAADTVVACGRRILPKAEDAATARKCLKLLSGRRHKVITAVGVFDEQGKYRCRLVESVVKFKVLTDTEINSYINSGEWEGKAGGYAIQGYAGSYITYMSGSYSNIVGLPLYETRNLLQVTGVI